MTNPFFLADHLAPFGRLVAITPSDSTTFAVTRGIYVGVTGDVTALDANGNSILLKAMPVGIHNLCLTAVKATGTTATNLVALY